MATLQAILPREASVIDPVLSMIGSDVAYQKVVYAQEDAVKAHALIVVEQVRPHPKKLGQVGAFYGTIFNGLKLGDTFKTWSSLPLGEMWYDSSVKKWKVCS